MSWNGGFCGVEPHHHWNGQPVGHYQPGYAYPVGHPYHHDSLRWNGEPLGPYQQGFAYPDGHPYYHHHKYYR